MSNMTARLAQKKPAKAEKQSEELREKTQQIQTLKALNTQLENAIKFSQQNAGVQSRFLTGFLLSQGGTFTIQRDFVGEADRLRFETDLKVHAAFLLDGSLTISLNESLINNIAAEELAKKEKLIQSAKSTD